MARRLILFVILQLIITSHGENDLDCDPFAFDSSKHSKKENIEQPPIPISDGVEPKVKIIDLNFDCLANICRFLVADDLLNVAQTNSHLTEAANYVSQHYGEKIIHVSDSRQLPKIELEEFDLRRFPAISKRIFFNSSEIRSVLRYVGEGIRDLQLDLSKVRDSEGLIRDIEKYCSGTLVSMEVHGVFDSFELNESFTNLQSISFVNGTLNESLLRFNKWFPGMKSLKLSNVKLVDANLVKINFPHLEHLTVEIDELNIFTLSDFKIILMQNQQIRRLNILKYKCYDYWEDRGSNVIEFVKETLPDLEEFSWGPSMHRHINRNITLSFRNLKKVHAFIGGIPNSMSGVTHIPFEFGKLKTMTLEFTGILQEIVPFVGTQNNLTTLKLISGFKRKPSHPSILNIVSSLPILIELYLDGFQVCSDDLKELLTHFETLNKIQWLHKRLSPNDMGILKNFKRLAGWNYTIEYTSKYIISTCSRQSMLK